MWCGVRVWCENSPPSDRPVRLRCWSSDDGLQIIARKAKDRAAPRARPRDRKKAMMAPAVSASWGATFLEEHTERERRRAEKGKKEKERGGVRRREIEMGDRDRERQKEKRVMLFIL